MCKLSPFGVFHPIITPITIFCDYLWTPGTVAWAPKFELWEPKGLCEIFLCKQPLGTTTYVIHVSCNTVELLHFQKFEMLFHIFRKLISVQLSFISQQHTHLFLYILSVIFFVDIRFWYIIFHSQSMVPDLHRQTLKQQNMPQVNILNNFKVKDVCACPNSWLRASYYNAKWFPVPVLVGSTLKVLKTDPGKVLHL